MADNTELTTMMVNSMGQAMTAMLKISPMVAFTSFVNVAIADAFVLKDPDQNKAIAKWNEAVKYTYTKREIKQMAYGHGTMYTYHGGPEEFVESFVLSGLHEYTTYGLAREVAGKYKIPFKLFEKFVPRVSHKETFKAMSTAPILIAMRWASSFKLGEVLSDFDSHARMLRYALDTFKNDKHFSDHFSDLYDKGFALAKSKGIQGSYENIADVMGLPEKYPREKTTGAIAQITIRIDPVAWHIQHDAQMALNSIEEHPNDEEAIIRGFNDHYLDLKVTPEQVLSKRIVLRGIPYHTVDVVHDVLNTYQDPAVKATYMVIGRGQLIKVPSVEEENDNE